MVRVVGGSIDYDEMPGAGVDRPVTLTSPVQVNPLTPDVYISSVIARPKGGVHEKNAIMTGAGYATVCEHLVTTGKRFQLAKTIVSSPQDVLYKLVWGTTDISIEVFVGAKVPLTDWYPWDYETIPGDGAKTLKIQARTPPAGTNATCQAEIVGEEV